MFMVVLSVGLPFLFQTRGTMKIRNFPFKLYSGGGMTVWVANPPELKPHDFKYTLFKGDGSLLDTMKYLRLLSEFLDSKGLEFNDSTEEIFATSDIDVRILIKFQQFVETLYLNLK